ncbi:MAG: hypothetical protein HY909_09550 [Deltaproteobacteria bacterium]|nr:hypothetical protein [Deltaproteobacteria bacterium]
MAMHPGRVRGTAVLLVHLAAGCAAPRAPVPVTVTCVVPPAPACACAHAPPTPSTDAGTVAVAPDAAVTPPPEDRTVARWGGAWHRATVLGSVCPGFVRVHFAPDAEGETEVVSVRDVQEPDAQGRLPELRASPPGEPVTASTALRPGSAVLALSGGQWWPSRVRVLRANGGVRIRYDGYGPEWDEDLARDHLRRPGGEALTHPPGVVEPAGGPVPSTLPLTAGMAVQARSRGRWFDARVLAVECGDLVRVHFPGWEPVWDSVIPRDHLRVTPTTR